MGAFPDTDLPDRLFPVGDAVPPEFQARVIRLAEELVADAQRLAQPAERRRQGQLHRLLSDPEGLTFSTLMADRSCRSRSPSRTSDAAARLVRRLGVPRRAFANYERLGLFLLPFAASVLPTAVTNALRSRIEAQASPMLRDARPGPLGDYLRTRRQQGVAVNVNRLGEALVGEREAEARLLAYRELATHPEVDTLSVKASSLCSQLSVVAFESSVSTLAERLGRLFDAAPPAALIYLDMESYDELALTTEALLCALRPRGRERVRAGLVVQAYVPDAHAQLAALLAFSRTRVAQGGERLTLRFVKGANLATERVQASAQGWQVPIYPDKASVDASYRWLLDAALRSEHADQIRVGVGSHNVFELAHALCLAEQRGVREMMHVELLEGMAEPLRRALAARGIPTLVYTPVVDPGGFQSAVAYLVRRLDENASEANFLRRAFDMQPGDAAFEMERQRYQTGLSHMASLSRAPRRVGQPYADRTQPPRATPGPFRNEPNTDFTSLANRQWLDALLTRQRAARPVGLTSVIGGRRVGAGEAHPGHDPSRPGYVPYRVQLCDDAALTTALDVAEADPDRWAVRQLSERAHLVRRVAGALQKCRGELIGLMVSDAGKAPLEGDAEVSEAIDFAEYYPRSALAWARQTGGSLCPRGVTLVAAPWNFPLAIPLGGTLAALLSGNRVLLKPAPEAPWVASRAAELCWQAGIPQSALQLVLCDDEHAARLSANPRVSSVVLTGSTAAARAIRRARPSVFLSAETGGKNALIVSALSDREQAARDAVLSAFGHAGQKCSAASLLICEAEVYDDPAFMQLLADAAESLPVGPAYAPGSVVTPLINPPGADLLRGLLELDDGESWLVQPRADPKQPRLWSPGIKLGVSPGSFSHVTELFGPVLSVMRARNVQHAIELAEQPGYGLTAGLSSLDEREQQLFVSRMTAGNLYINRTTTGAIVRRQPFGGMRGSSFGPGAKAGGPNYVAQLAHARVPPSPASTTLAGRTAEYAHWWRSDFSRPRDPSRVLGEDNQFRYLPCPDVWIRAAADASPLDVASACVAARVCGCTVTLSVHPEFAARTESRRWRLPYRVESDAALLARGETGSPPSRVRVVGSVTEALWRWAAIRDVHIAAEPVSACGRVELLHYLREQSVTTRFHRFGHLGGRDSQG